MACHHCASDWEDELPPLEDLLLPLELLLRLLVLEDLLLPLELLVELLVLEDLLPPLELEGVDVLVVPPVHGLLACAPPPWVLVAAWLLSV
ncbi:MAG: hypothetical protein K6T66_14390 [Peptococcaceae bacterium]|nr:hypothetical protein [Peptococcaceae bacterium]